MAEETNPQGGVPQAPPSVEDRMMAFVNNESAKPVEETPEQAEAPAPAEEQQPQDLAPTDELTPEDIPDETPVEQSAVDEFEIVHNGQQKKLTREETIKLAQQGFDYTQKTQQLAEARKAIEVNLQRSQEALQLAPQVAQELATVKALESQLAQYQKVDWVSLASNDPLEYPKHRAQYDTLVSAYQQAVGQFQQKAGALTQRQQELRAEVIRAEYPKLLEKIPEWKDPAKYEQGAKEVRAYLLAEGAEPEAVDGLTDAVAVAIARKAMMYDRLVKSKIEKVKLARTAPPVTRPGATQGQGQARADQDQQLRGKLRKSGSLQDAAALLLNRMK